jgi:hypothetical protein
MVSADKGHIYSFHFSIMYQSVNPGPSSPSPLYNIPVCKLRVDFTKYCILLSSYIFNIPPLLPSTSYHFFIIYQSVNPGPSSPSPLYNIPVCKLRVDFTKYHILLSSYIFNIPPSSPQPPSTSL